MIFYKEYVLDFKNASIANLWKATIPPFKKAIPPQNKLDLWGEVVCS